MELSLFSFLMAVLWSSFFFCLLTFLQKDIRFIRHFGVTVVFLIYMCCILRFLFPVEFSFTRVIPDSVVYAAIYKVLCRDKIDIAFFRISVLGILTAVSITGTVILTLRFSGRYLLFHRVTSVSGEMNTAQRQQLFRVLKRLEGCPQYDCRVSISYSCQVGVPVGIGLWKRKILLPCFTYTDTELYYILLHEFTHFANKDLFVKMAVAFLRNIFWWNPFIYLMQRNLDEILEIKCDLCVVSTMDNREKADYLSVIISSLEKAPDTVSPISHLPNACLMDTHKKELLKKRFVLTASSKSSGNTSGNRTIFIGYLFLAAVTLIGSYSFILQPQYSTPEEEIVTEQNTYVMTPDNTYLLMDKTGQCYVTGLHIPVIKVTAETVQMMIHEGFQIKELNYEENQKISLYGIYARSFGADFLCQSQ